MLARLILFFFVLLSMACIASAAESLPETASASAVDATDGPALTAMAARYEHAEGVPRDYQYALSLYCAAARMGDADAQYAMGWMYANGRGVARNDATAAQLFQVAAEQGHELARRMLNNMSGQDVSALPACLNLESLNPEIAHTDEKKAPLFLPKYPKGRVSQLVEKWAPRYSIDADLALAVISVESGFNEQALSPKNAQGLMQLTPDTAQRFSVKNAFDAEDNIKGGLSYLRWLLALFRGNVTLVAAAYNAGERAVEKYHGVPPYLETIDYVQRINRLYQKSTHPFQRNIVDASSVVMRPTRNGKP
ncbi:transglycosylase SLT domain-containing protein [Undibacterium sp. Jales W-56]|uniref:transglycosylase SLT domain-containing protein n=1 Tax=Undibacterium sp. Jales W-56 TaxID=2897325 RepID=UPI0021CFA682|nr:transglycosylase SLT domain-containing protein [Undibacterium sp. Jales W-56]MCU6434146.1 transglycosylase SLT domain-containing protein [Undibacterium sp. Jales W-56]